MYFTGQDSDEQERLLASLPEPGHAAHVEKIVERSKQKKLYMAIRHPDYAKLPPGKIWDGMRFRRGLEMPQLQKLQGAATIAKADDLRGMDWAAPEKDKPYRWTGPNPKAKFLVSYTTERPVRFTCEVHNITEASWLGLGILVNGVEAPYALETFGRDMMRLTFIAPLLPDRHSIITFAAPIGDYRGYPRGIAIGDIHLEVV
jgi:hypothetical protein